MRASHSSLPLQPWKCAYALTSPGESAENTSHLDTGKLIWGEKPFAVQCNEKTHLGLAFERGRWKEMRWQMDFYNSSSRQFLHLL